jgi:4-amino-4-deoxy-L-arabinose transferase-like glycosyltransferase
VEQTKYLTRNTSTTHSGRRRVIAPALALLLVALGLWHLSAPPTWWDEGWTLSVARTWVEHGHYGRLLNNELAPPGLEAALPTTGSVALSFRLLGVGLWQGRLPGVLYAVGALGLMYALAARLYNQRIAVATMVVLLLLPMHPQLHPLIMGRQVLAEMPMLCFLLAGYLALLPALRRSRWMLLVAILFWALAINTKAQTLPFWGASLAVPLGAMLIKRQWKTAVLLGLGLPSSYMFAGGLLWLQRVALQDGTLVGTPVTGIYEVTAFVLSSFNRMFALQMFLFLGLPTFFGLGYAVWQWMNRFKQRTSVAEVDVVRLALLTLSGSWLAWYLMLSVGVPRYLFPATFLGSVFVAPLFARLTAEFNIVETLNRTGALLRRRQIRWENIGALTVVVVLASMLSLTLLTLQRYYVNNNDQSAQEVASYLNTQTAPDALIETYESELHFLLNRPYHYPPDQLHVELNRRSLLGLEVDIKYDPLEADPDYLVVGDFSRNNDLYEPVLVDGTFRLLQRHGGYNVYERVR